MMDTFSFDLEQHYQAWEENVDPAELELDETLEEDRLPAEEMKDEHDFLQQRGY